MCIDVVEVWLGLPMGKIRQFLIDLFARHRAEFSFQDYNLSKYQWIFTKPAMCIYIVEIWFGMLMGHMTVVGYYHFAFLLLYKVVKALTERCGF